LARRKRDGSDEIARIIQRADIGKVAKFLGIQIDTRSRQPLRAICPFHDDNDPSLNLYRSSGAAGDRDHYHCFVCGAHGDVVALIQNYERVTFWEAIQRLANIEGIELPAGRGITVDRRSGAAMLASQIKAAAANDPAFKAFAVARGFDPLFLHRAGAAAIDLNSLADLARNDRAAEERLVEAGIFRRDDKSEGPDLYGTRLKGFFRHKRIVFEIADPEQGIAGFAARSLVDEKPKYLFSYDLLAVTRCTAATEFYPHFAKRAGIVGRMP
jgi:DNA primase